MPIAVKENKTIVRKEINFINEFMFKVVWP